jgi:hypothetical protein
MGVEATPFTATTRRRAFFALPSTASPALATAHCRRVVRAGWWRRYRGTSPTNAAVRPVGSGARRWGSVRFYAGGPAPRERAALPSSGSTPTEGGGQTGELPELIRLKAGAIFSGWQPACSVIPRETPPPPADHGTAF